MVMTLDKSILRNKSSSKFWHHQNYVILITLFSKESFLFAVKAFICLHKTKTFYLGKELTFTN